MQSNARRAHRWLFWLILGAYSTFFAEVFAGSAMFPFFDPWGILVILPLYGLHAVLLAAILFKRGKPTFSGLVFSGMLFGLYEAYMTKVLWQPPWGAPLILAEIAVVEVFVLVFWWHTWFAFITPLLLAEQLLTSTRPILNALPGKLRNFFASWKGWLAVLVFGGIFQSVNSPSISASLLSGTVNGAVLLFLTWLWQRVTKEKRYTLPELLPNRIEFIALSLWLAALYIFLGLFITPERIPGAVGQGIILLMYLLLTLLLILSLRSTHTDHKPVPPGSAIPTRRWLLLWCAFTATLVLAKALLGSLSGVIILLSWFGGSVFGAAMFVRGVLFLRQ